MKRQLPPDVLPAGSRSLLFLLLVAAVVLGTVFSANAQVSIVKDIAQGNSNDPEAFNFLCVHTDGNLYFQYYQELWKSDGTSAGTVPLKNFDYMTSIVSSGPYVYFIGYYWDEDHTLGEELWRSDGTPEGTVLVKDIMPGTQGSYIHSMVDVNGTLFFVANNGVNGEELWKSDGTTEGTVLVKDILRVVGSSKPRYLTALNGKVYFRANDGQNGIELWMSDGTEAGTVMVANINLPTRASSNPDHLINLNGTLYFFATDGTNGRQLWKSNGTIGNASIVRIIRPGGNNQVTLMAKVDNLIFFQANDGIHGNELWRSDGTEAGTFMAKDLTPGPGSATAYATPHIEFIGAANGRIYFLGIATNFLDLWVSDGTTAGTYPITSGNNPGFPWRHFGLVEYQGRAYFGGMSSNYETSYLELWESDGTAAGTFMVIDNIGDGTLGRPNLTAYKDKIFLFGKGELWRTDGTAAGVEVVKTFGPQAGSGPVSLTDVNGELFFAAAASIWKSDGTADGTVQVGPFIGYANELTNVNGTIYFAGTDYNGNSELWKSDGTVAGTHMVVDLTTDPNARYTSSDPENFTVYNGALYFTAKTTYHGPHLFTTDGTPEGTRTVKDAEYHDQGFAGPEQLTVVGDKLFFTAEWYLGRELHVYDGLNPPAMVRDIKIHWQGSNPLHLTAFKGNVYFQADNRGNGYELWRSDGTPSGTYLLKDIRKDDVGVGDELAPVDMGNMVATSDWFFFSAIKPNGKNSLWKSDGTANGTSPTTGTRPLVEFAGMPEAHMLAGHGNTVIFTLRYDSYMELWKSDGTIAGTSMIRSMPDMRFLAQPAIVETVDGVHYFVGYDYASYMIWRTDGTPEGTYEIAFSGRPVDLETSSGKLYVSLDNPEYGWELFLINDARGTASASARSAPDPEAIGETEDEAIFTSYPNPFTSQLSLKVQGSEEQKFRLSVITVNGTIIDQGDYSYNTEHHIGQHWREGFYILQINTGEKRIIRKVIKQR